MFSINKHADDIFRVPVGDCVFLTGHEFQSYKDSHTEKSADYFMDQTSLTLVDAKCYWLPQSKVANTFYDWCQDMLTIIKVVNNASFNVSLKCNAEYVPCTKSQNTDFATIKIWSLNCPHMSADDFSYFDVNVDHGDHERLKDFKFYDQIDQNYIIRTLLSRAARDFVTNSTSWFEFEDDSYIDQFKKIEQAIMIINWQGNYPKNEFFSTKLYPKQESNIVCHDGFIMEGKTKSIAEKIEASIAFLFDSEMDIFYRTPLKATGKIMQQKYIPFIAAFGYLLATVSCSRYELDLNRSFITHAAFKDTALFDMTKFFLSLMARYSNGLCVIKINMYNHIRESFDFPELPWPFKEGRKMELELYKTHQNLNIQCLKFYYDCVNVLTSFHANLLCFDYVYNEKHFEEYNAE